MKTATSLLTKIVLALTLALALSSAHADRGSDGRGREANRQDTRKWDQQSRRQRESSQVKRPGEDRGQRMSPEERQQLRRDIKDAGKEIYPPRK